MTTTLEPRLREEDLVPGQRWVHPETKLEYEDFHAFLCGKDPIPHWRNARIKEALAKGRDGYASPHGHARSNFASGDAWIASLIRHYDRDGNPFVAARTDERGLSFSA